MDRYKINADGSHTFHTFKEGQMFNPLVWLENKGNFELDKNGEYFSYYNQEMENGQFMPDFINPLYLKELKTKYKSYYLDVVNAKLAELDYDSLATVKLWENDSTFGTEASYILTWYKDLVEHNYQLVNNVKNGLPIPTKEEFINQLPKYEG